MLDVRGTDEIPHLVIDRPDRGNAVTTEVLERLTAELERLAGTSGAIILRGEGGRFCAGADLGELADRDGMEALDAALPTCTSTIARVGVPVVAALEGYAFGAGVDLAWSCDVVVADEQAEIGIPATRLGIMYHPASLRRLHARLGSRALRRLLVAGDRLPAADHADVVCPAGQVIAEAERVARAASELDSRAIWATKHVLDDLDHERGLAFEWEAMRAELLDRRADRGLSLD